MHALKIPQSHSKDLSSSCTGVQRSLENFVDLRVEGAAHQWTEEVKGLGSTTENFVTGHDSLLKGVASAVDQFVAEDIRRDMPTGMAQ